MSDPERKLDRPADPVRSLRVAVADDHPLWVKALTALINEEPGLEVVGAAGTVTDTVRLCAAMDADVLVVDYEMPVGKATAVLDGLAAGAGDTRVVVLSSFIDDSLVRSVVARGARGYLTKTATLADLGARLRTVAEGGTAFCSAAEKALERTGSEATRPNATDGSLSPREQEVIALAAAGLTDAAIASRLGVSPHTVRTHLTRVFTKLGAANRAEAVALNRTGSRDRFV